jgi:hypothetical protein
MRPSSELSGRTAFMAARILAESALAAEIAPGGETLLLS